jgi:hypothetical protein
LTPLAQNARSPELLINAIVAYAIFMLDATGVVVT